MSLLPFRSWGWRGHQRDVSALGFCVQTHLQNLESTYCILGSVLGSEVTDMNLEEWREERQMVSPWQCPVWSAGR